jgi:hypothetical protein
MLPRSPNVTLDDDLKLKQQSIPCFLCRDAVEIRCDKHRKPYFICEGCGIQAFIRRKAGMQLLRKLQENSFSSLEIIQLGRELSLLKREKSKINSQKGIFFQDEDLTKAEEAINQKTQEITEKIKKLSKGENSHD